MYDKKSLKYTAADFLNPNPKYVTPCNGWKEMVATNSQGEILLIHCFKIL